MLASMIKAVLVVPLAALLIMATIKLAEARRLDLPRDLRRLHYREAGSCAALFYALIVCIIWI